jgi:hypothetical protein
MESRSAASLVLLTLSLMLSTLLAACGDGQPAFCSPLSKAADLSGIAAALRSNDLSNASEEAAQLRQLAGEAPPEIRADFIAVADSVREIVDLLATERKDGQVDPGQFERRREDLNKSLGQMGRRSDRIRVWTSEQCGIDLE